MAVVRCGDGMCLRMQEERMGSLVLDGLTEPGTVHLWASSPANHKCPYE